MTEYDDDDCCSCTSGESICAPQFSPLKLNDDNDYEYEDTNDNDDDEDDDDNDGLNALRIYLF